jgi:chorismate--pyruvate lyase
VITFPVSLAANWQPASAFPDLTQQQQGWLLEAGSLTAKLKSHCQAFSVEVLNEAPFDLTAEQQALLNTSLSQALNREVLLLCDGKPMVYAQSWLPADDTLKKQQLLNMGTRPLGDVIFQDPSLQRTEIELAEFSQQHAIQALTAHLGLPSNSLWGRRSVFALSNAHFLVAEVFLPEAYIYL